jgi:hypothetical protein
MLMPMLTLGSGRFHDSGDCTGFVANRSPLQRYANSGSVFAQTLRTLTAGEGSVCGGSQQLFAGWYFVDGQQRSNGPAGDFCGGVSVKLLRSTAPGLDGAIEGK